MFARATSGNLTCVSTEETWENEDVALDAIGEGEPDETSDEAGGGGEEPASR